MMAKQNATKATRKHHFYVACLGYGIGVTDSNGEPLVRVLAFDSKRQAHNYVTSYDGLDAHTYAEAIGARGAKALMRRQLIKKLQYFSLDADACVEVAGRVHRMGAVELVEAYRKCVFC